MISHTHRPKNSNEIRTVGIIGAGKLGTTLARLAVAVGYRVLISASGAPARIDLAIDVLAHGAEPVWTADLLDQADVVILAVPLSRLSALPSAAFGEKLTIDATNYWAPVDGALTLFDIRTGTTSERVRDLLPGARLVKSLSHLGYHDLDRRPQPQGNPDRLAVGVAADDPADMAAVARIVDRLGFDPVLVGPLSAGGIMETGGPVFGQALNSKQFLAVLTAEETQNVRMREA